MKEILVKAFWPQIAVGVLLLTLGALTLLSKGAKRGSPLHRARLTVLAALVAMTVGSAAGCSGNNSGPQPNDQGDSTGNVEGQGNPPPPTPMCYEAPPERFDPPVPTCYEPMPPTRPPGDGGVAPPIQPGPPQPQLMCYAPMDVPPSPGDGGAQIEDNPTPEEPRTPPPRRMCYRPRVMPREDNSGKS